MWEESGKKLGFGFMRLPVTDGKNAIDYDLVCQMVDYFLEQGFSYFDTAYPYHNGLSEAAVKRCIADRYPRDRFYLADKIAPCFVRGEGHLEEIFRGQLEKCGVSYFDVYLLHNLGASFYRMAREQRAFPFLRRIKEEGGARLIGFSFHDTPELLEQILSENPFVDVVQLQINYVDWDNPAIRSRECYEVARKHGKKVIVMEPVKGGGLASLPREVREVFQRLGDASPASYAIRYAASLEGVAMVLSGMNTMEQLWDNASVMKKFTPLNQNERQAVEEVRRLLEKCNTIPCTGCGYCLAGCPRRIAIPSLFSIYNQKKKYGEGNFPEMHYNKNTVEQGFGKAGACIGCGQCEEICPQHLKIPKLLKQVAAVFE